MADYKPLSLWNCKYDDIKFEISDDNYINLITTLEDNWEDTIIQLSQLEDLLKEIKSLKDNKIDLSCSHVEVRYKSYKQLENRAKVRSYEERIKTSNKKRKTVLSK